MTNTRTFIAAVGATVLAGAIVACNKAPTSPGPSVSLPPGTAPAPTSFRLEVDAPSAIAPGESVQLTANAVKVDGSRENVTGQTEWTTSNAPVLQVGATGLARGIAPGEAVLFARYKDHGESAQALVLPPGTYRLAGHVLERGLGLDKVTVTVISGVGQGFTTVTNPGGGYALYGVKGPIRIQLKKDNYDNRIEAVYVVGHQTFDVEVAPRPQVDLTGTYVFGLVAARCRSAGNSLPTTAANRSYTASVVQDGFRLSVTLSGADFIITRNRGNHFSGIVDGAGGITLTIVGDTVFTNDPYYNFAEQDLVERFGPSGALLVSGTLTAATTSFGMSGVLKGVIAVVDRVAPPFTPIWESTCWADTHAFELRRR